MRTMRLSSDDATYLAEPAEKPFLTKLHVFVWQGTHQLVLHWQSTLLSLNDPKQGF